MDAAAIAQVELHILRRMREVAQGDHASNAAGVGVDLVGLKDWEPGDAIGTVDWAQSSLNNFSPLVTRQFEERRGGTVLVLADASRSTRCGMHGVRIATLVERTLAVLILSAAYFQDACGFVAFGDRLETLQAEPPRTGRAHVLRCLQRWQAADGTRRPGSAAGSALATAAACLRRPALVPVISDFLMPDIGATLAEFARLNAVHDVLLAMVDARFAYELPASAATWVEVFDVETGGTRTLSRREARALAGRIATWQADVTAQARAWGLDVVLLEEDPTSAHDELVALMTRRRARRVRA